MGCARAELDSALRPLTPSSLPSVAFMLAAHAVTKGGLVQEALEMGLLGKTLQSMKHCIIRG